MLLLPLGLDNMVVKRVPAVSATLAVGCVLGYLAVLGLGDDALALAFVPAAGPLQIGWLTSMFLHLGLVHLLGNLLFFYLAGPVIEDAWGRGRFLVLFVLGDAVGNAAMWLAEPSSELPSVGASAAVAACVGALCVQYPRRQVRMFFWYWIRVSTFFMPVVLWGALWLLLEVFELAKGAPGSGMVFAAHLGGFLAGVAMAVVMRLREASVDATTVVHDRAPRPAPAVSRPAVASTSSASAPSRRATPPVVGKPSAAGSSPGLGVRLGAGAAPTTSPPRAVPKAPKLRSDPR